MKNKTRGNNYVLVALLIFLFFVMIGMVYRPAVLTEQVKRKLYKQDISRILRKE